MKDLGNILIIAAHPDDDILGCGGLMAKLQNKNKIKVIFIAEGTSCRFSKEELKTKEAEIKKQIEKRNRYAVSALKSLSIEDIKFVNLDCGRLDQYPQIEINKIIEEEIINFKPETIFTHSENDLNTDHKRVFNSVMTASRPCSNFSPKNIFSFEVLSSSEWKFSEVFKPNFFVELSEKDVEAKWDAMKFYETEISKSPHPRSKKGIYTLASFRGMQIGANYAEAFKSIRQSVK